VIVAVLAVLAVVRLVRLPTMGFNNDEFQHLHIAFSIHQGLLPFRDFFDHHGLLYHYLISPFMGWARPELSFAAAKSFLVAMRFTSWSLSLTVVYVVYRLARGWRGERVALYAALFAGTNTVFSRISIQIRPDVAAALAVLLSFAFFLRGLNRLQDGADHRRPIKEFCASGLLFGAAITFTQKSLFAAPGFACALALLIDGPLSGRVPLRTRLSCSAAFAGLSCVPFTCIAAYFLMKGAFADFYECYLHVNLFWPGTSSWVKGEFRNNALLIAAGLAGLGAVAQDLIRRRSARPMNDLALLCLSSSLLAGVYLIPELTAQYLFFVAPFLAILAARGIDAGEACFARLTRGRVPAAVFQSVAILAFAVPGIIAYQNRARYTSYGQFRLMEAVMKGSKPGERVIDGFTGGSWFRPHVGYHFYIHNVTHKMIVGEKREEVRRRVLDPLTAPRLIIVDSGVGGLPIQDLIKSDYEPVLAGLAWENWTLWARKPAPRPS